MIHKILMLKGLPGSGKTTYAEKLVKENDNWARVNKDDIRDMLHCGKWSPDNEEVVKAIWICAVGVAMAVGNVVVDDTNFNPKHEKDLRDLVKLINAEAVKKGEDDEWEFETRFFDTPLEDCIARDLKRPNPVGEKVIREMAEKNNLEH